MILPREVLLFSVVGSWSVLQQWPCCEISLPPVAVMVVLTLAVKYDRVSVMDLPISILLPPVGISASFLQEKTIAIVSAIIDIKSFVFIFVCYLIDSKFQPPKAVLLNSQIKK